MEVGTEIDPVPFMHILHKILATKGSFVSPMLIFENVLEHLNIGSVSSSELHKTRAHFFVKLAPHSAGGV